MEDTEWRIFRLFGSIFYPFLFDLNFSFFPFVIPVFYAFSFFKYMNS